jgi:3-methyladenine DNA glycosylase AlkD
MKYEEIMRQLKSPSDLSAVAGMKQFGISTDNTYGISIPNLRKISEEIGRDHQLAEQLWVSGIHEARILASMIDDARMVTDGRRVSTLGMSATNAAETFLIKPSLLIKRPRSGVPEKRNSSKGQVLC